MDDVFAVAGHSIPPYPQAPPISAAPGAETRAGVRTAGQDGVPCCHTPNSGHPARKYHRKGAIMSSGSGPEAIKKARDEAKEGADRARDKATDTTDRARNEVSS